MAPEQIRDPSAVDGRADVFALGCVIYECLTGAPAFGGDDPVTVLAQVLFQAAREPSTLIELLPDAVDRLIGGLLEKRRELRPEASAVADDLASLLGSPLALELDALPRAPERASTLPAPAFEPAATLTAAPEPPPLRPSQERWPQRLHTLQAALPAAAGALIGRERELATLLPQLERGVTVALWGSAGMGKTRLALELVQRALAAGVQPLDALLFVDLGAARTTADAVRVVAEHAQLLISATDQPEALVGALIAKLGRVLLVLDRVDPLAGQIEPLVRLWTDAAPRLRVIVTSRVRLRLPDAFELGPLSTAARVGLSDAASLVHARTRAVMPELPEASALDARTADALERVARALDGIPLAIELAAARADVLGIDGLLSRLSTPLQLAGASADPHALTMRGAIAWSWSALSAIEQAACMQCAVFREGFDLAAAQAVIALPEGAPTLPEVLGALRERSLLVRRAAQGDALKLRMSMFGAVREFVREQAATRAAADAALAGAPARHARYYAALAAELVGAPAADALRASLCGADRENLVAAAEHALAAQPPDAASALHVLRALEPALLAGGAFCELARLLDRALSLVDEAAAPDLALDLAAARQLRARVLTPAGQLAQARSELQAALDGAQRLGAVLLAAGIWLDLGVVHHFGRELDQAQRCYETALALLEQHDDVVNEARCTGNLAAIAHDRGELLAALPGYRRAIALLESAHEPRLLANFYGNLALCEHELGQLESARGSYQRALALLEPLGDARLLGIVLSNLGTLELGCGERGSAHARQERACALLQDAGDPRSAGLARSRRAVALSLLSRMEEAELAIAGAERSLRRDPLGAAVCAMLRAFVDLGQARRALAGSAFAQAGAELDRAQQRADDAEHSLLHGRRLYDQCDDVRLYLGLLRPELARARDELAPAHAAARGHGAA
jgi:predicted ATPase/Tfp pilus assembly protein PilF